MSKSRAVKRGARKFRAALAEAAAPCEGCGEKECGKITKTRDILIKADREAGFIMH